MQRMTLPPDEHVVVDFQPKNGNKDLHSRLIAGIKIATEHGHDFCFVIEDDDFYPEDYFVRMQAIKPGWDFIGDDSTTYYHLANNGFQTEHHRDRASLFTTGFRLSALDGFDWNRLHPNKVFIDISLWEHAKRKRKRRVFVDSGAVGIKHGMGLTGGIGHRQRYRTFDTNWKVLASKVDSESLEFYKAMHAKLKAHA